MLAIHLERSIARQVIGVTGAYAVATLLISASGARVMDLMTTRFIATGGEMSANSKLMVNSTPYQTLSMPSWFSTGTMTGVVMRMIEIDSSTRPSTNSNAITAR